MDKHTIIGPYVRVNLPEHKLMSVPAKIDTGADSSSIWASKIEERAGVLTYVLFNESSPYYTGQVNTAKHFTVRSIKNSFGKSEIRFKVPITLQIGNRIINARLTLANRENNRFPILIGRRTLGGKFLVDVNHKGYLKPKTKILVFVNKGNEKITQFYKLMNKENKDLDITISKYKDVAIKVSNQGIDVKLLATGENLVEYDLIHFKTTINNMGISALLATIAEQLNIPYFDKTVKGFTAFSKLNQYVKLQLAGVSVPKTIAMSPDNMQSRFKDIQDYLGMPFILKDNNGRKGRYNFLIKNEKQFQSVLKICIKDEIELVGQEFIEGDGDYRVVVLGKKVKMVIYRKNLSDSHLNNLSAGAKATLIDENELPGNARIQCIKAASAIDLQIAGVDFIKDKHSFKWYCLEVNKNPEFVGGAYVSNKRKLLAEYLKEQARI